MAYSIDNSDVHPKKTDLRELGRTIKFERNSTACNPTHRAAHHGGTRSKDDIIWIVLHDTEGGTAESVARWFASKASGGSTHLVVDENQCFRCLQDIDIPWGAPGANLVGWHIEMCGFASWSGAAWSKAHRRTLTRAAYKVARQCKINKIPIRFVTAEDLKNNKKGITTHREVSKAFGGTHTDPGPNFPMKLFLSFVRAYSISPRV